MPVAQVQISSKGCCFRGDIRDRVPPIPDIVSIALGIADRSSLDVAFWDYSTMPPRSDAEKADNRLFVRLIEPVDGGRVCFSTTSTGLRSTRLRI
jgi:hypothetical protein